MFVAEKLGHSARIIEIKNEEQAAPEYAPLHQELRGVGEGKSRRQDQQLPLSQQQVFSLEEQERNTLTLNQNHQTRKHLPQGTHTHRQPELRTTTAPKPRTHHQLHQHRDAAQPTRGRNGEEVLRNQSHVH